MKKSLLALFFALAVFLPAQAEEVVNIICLGDSLTEGYGIEKEEAYPHLVEKAIREKGRKANVINAGVSGSTTASGKTRLQWLLKKESADILILALGANDGLRGLKLNQSKENLAQIIELAQEKNIKVLLAGMRLPPNYGKKYTEEFHKMFTDLRKKYKVEMVPFILEEVGGNKELNLDDGIHPNQEGHKVIAKTVMKSLEPLL